MNEKFDEVHDELQLTCKLIEESIGKLIHCSRSTVHIRRSQFLHRSSFELLHREPRCASDSKIASGISVRLVDLVPLNPENMACLKSKMR